jgi:hypothetical protein
MYCHNGYPEKAPAEWQGSLSQKDAGGYRFPVLHGLERERILHATNLAPRGGNAIRKLFYFAGGFQRSSRFSVFAMTAF